MKGALRLKAKGRWVRLRWVLVNGTWYYTQVSRSSRVSHITGLLGASATGTPSATLAGLWKRPTGLLDVAARGAGRGARRSAGRAAAHRLPALSSADLRNPAVRSGNLHRMDRGR